MPDFAAAQHPVNIEDEMKRSYMDYAMSVIIGRALPDARDGLKPAHRRVLYGMKTMGLSPTRAYCKCAKIVGEVMGNFHPHGDVAIHDTLGRLAEDRSMRYPLVDGRAGIVQAYTTGRSSIVMRARSSIETSKKGDRVSIIISAIPYQINKAKLMERIADLVRDKVIEGISDLRDESDREGMRIVIELKRGEVAEVILNNLYKHTPLQSSFGIIMLAIVAGRPRVLTLLELVESVIDFRRDVVRGRT